MTTTQPPLQQVSISDIKRAASFRNLWLPTLHPAMDYTSINIGHLKDLYPNIWLYGPRGDVYITQLRALRAMLDRAWDDHTYVPPFVEDVRQFVLDLDELTDLARHEVTLMSLNEWRPAFPYDREGFGSETLYHDIKTHDVLDALDDISADNPGYYLRALMDDFIEHFTFHSLNHDLLQRHGDPVRVQLYVDYCQQWGIPA